MGLVSGCKSTQQVLTANVKSFGAKGNGKQDDTQAIQRALNKGGEVYLPAGIYLVNPLKFYSNTTIKGDGPNSIIKLKFNRPPITTDLQAVLYAGNIDTGPTENVTITNLTIDGSRDEINWQGVRGDGNANGISTWGTENLVIKDIRVVDCWTDGIFLSGTRRSKIFYNTKNFKFLNIEIDNCGRQGVSVISGENGIFEEMKISNINRTAPRAGFDFEPNVLKDKIRNIKVQNIDIASCGQGLVVAGVSIPREISFSNITISDVSHQYSIAVINAENIDFNQIQVDNTNGTSKYATLFVGSAKNISFNQLELKNSIGLAAIQVDPYSEILETGVTFDNFNITGFEHSAIYIMKPVSTVKFSNGIIKKGNTRKTPYAAAILHSENILLDNVSFETTANPYHIDNIGKEVKVKNGKFSKGVPKSNNENEIQN